MKAQVLVALLAAVPALAQQQVQQHSTIDGFALQQFDASYAGDRFFAVPDAVVTGRLRPSFKLGVDYAYLPLQLRDRSTGMPVTNGAIVRDQVYLRLDAALALADRVRLDLSLPFSAVIDGDPAAPRSEAMHSGSLADVRVGARLGLFGRLEDKLSIGFQADVWAPTGSKADFASDGTVRARLQLIASGSFSPKFFYSAAIGAQIRPYRDLGLGEVSSAFTWSAAAGLKLLDGHFQIGPELFGAAGPSGVPFEAMLGASYSVSGFSFGVGGGAGVGHAPGTAAARAMATVGWTY